MLEAIKTREDLSGYIDGKFKENSWTGIQEILDALVEKTEKGGIIDPFANPDGGLWNNVFNVLYFSTQYHEALTLAQRFLDTYYSVQEKHKERIHKGTPLQYVGIAYFSLNQSEQSRKFHIFAFIEDIIRHFESEKQKGIEKQKVDEILMTPAVVVLKARFRTPDKELRNLQDFVWNTAKTKVPFYPEEIYSKWIIEGEKKSEIIARSIEERLYRPNLPYLQRLKEEALKDDTGEALELFAFYLFSCVDGFEPILRKKTPSFHFDVVVRNLIDEHQLLKNLGEYIGVECKRISGKVNAKELDHFIVKLRLHNMKCGVIFTLKGISGAGYGKNYGKLIIDRTLQRDGIIVFDITNDDMEKICQGYNLLALLLRKYEDTRFK